MLQNALSITSLGLWGVERRRRQANAVKPVSCVNSQPDLAGSSISIYYALIGY